MNRAELKKELKKLEGQVKEIREKLDKPKSVVWKPEIDESYYYVCPDGYIGRAVWDGGSFDEGVYAVSSCYRTEQEAINARDAKIILTDLQRMADEANGEKIRWKQANLSHQYHVYLNLEDDRIMVGRSNLYAIRAFTPMFKTEELAQRAIDIIISKYAKERVKMALSGIWR